MKIRDRVRELRRIRARELVPNPNNWGSSQTQAAALKGLLAEIGYADGLLARELPDGRLQLLDGHLRAETTPDMLVPVLLLDLEDEEADKLLLTLDQLGAMAECDRQKLEALLVNVRTEDAAVEELLRQTAGNQLWNALHPESEPPARIDLAGELQKCSPSALVRQFGAIEKERFLSSS